MKIVFSIRTLLIITWLLLTGTVFSQHIFHPKNNAAYIYGDKLSNPAGDRSIATGRVSIFALKSFAKEFPNVSDEKWYRIKDKYLVEFVKNDNRQKALYNMKGTLIYNINYGSEKDLPADIRKMIKREYVEYLILRATNVNEHNRNIWVIDLREDNQLVIARVENKIIEGIYRYQTD